MKSGNNDASDQESPSKRVKSKGKALQLFCE